MVGYRKPFQCEVLTPAGSVWSGQAFSLTFPAGDGMMGVLGGRSPLASTIGAGALRIEDVRGSTTECFVLGGFARVADDRAIVLAEECTPAQDLDREEVWEELQRARRLPTETPEQVDRREEFIEIARRKFRLVQAYRRRRLREH
jgi:F-type H+-transporting ATPase subunit epsilon